MVWDMKDFWRRNVKRETITNNVRDQFQEKYKNYNADTIELKHENKSAIQKELGLPEKDVPLLAVISRVVQHKGFDILIEGMNILLSKEDIQFVVLGMGEEHYINRLEYLKEKYPTKVSINNVFDGFDTIALIIFVSSCVNLSLSSFNFPQSRTPYIIILRFIS